MIKILFVCLGNICRSPMAEYVFKNMIKEKGLENNFYINSAATSNEEEGNGIHYGTKRKLEKQNIPYGNHQSRKMTKSDYEKYDYIIGMEDSNITNIKRIIGEDKEEKIYKLLDFADSINKAAKNEKYSNSRNIADPWYTGNFDKTYEDIVEGCNALLDYCIETHNL